MIAKLNKTIRRLEGQLARLRPVSTPGVRTNQTSRGVAKTSTAKTSQTNTQTLIPRWG